MDQITDNIVRWTPSDTIVLRGILRCKLWWACPAYVVQDTPEIIALYWPVGTPTRSRFVDEALENAGRFLRESDLKKGGSDETLYVYDEATKKIVPTAAGTKAQMEPSAKGRAKCERSTPE